MIAEKKTTQIGSVTVAQIVSGTLSVITALGTALVMLIQTQSNARIDELKATAAKQATLEDGNRRTSDGIQSTSTQLAAQVIELGNLKATIARLESLLAHASESKPTDKR